MHPGFLAKRQLDAQNRIVAAVEILSQKFDVTPRAAEWARQPEIQQMFRWEAIADFLEGLSTAERGVSVDDVLNIEGLSKTSIKAIKKHFNVPDEDDGATS